MSVYKKYYDLVKKFRIQIILGFILGVATLLTSILLPNLIGSLTNHIQRSTLTSDIIMRYCLIIFAVGLFNYIANGIWNYFFFQNYYYVDNEIRLRIFFKALSESPVFYMKNPIPDIINKATSDSANIGDVVGYGLMTLVDGVMFPLLIFVFMFRISFTLTLIPIISLPVMVFLVTKISRKFDSRYLAVQRTKDRLNDKAIETYNGIKVIKTFLLNRIVKEEFLEKVDDNLEEELNLQRVSTLFMPAVEIVMGISSVLSFIFGAFLIKKGAISYGELITFSMYLMYLSWPAFALSDLIVISKTGKNSFSRVEKLLNYESDFVVRNNLIELPSIESVEFKDLSFNYPGNDGFGLSGMSFKLKKGKRYGIVGKTGSGKTTILRNLIREYPNFHGEININGIPIREINFDKLKKKIGYVPQEHFLFSKSIGDNIKFYRDVDEESLNEAIETSDFAKDVSQLSEGIDTLSGELGISLSGGQKQRVSLSRALLTDVDLLVLDDVLSAVDTKTEKNILNNLDKKFKDKIVVISSHKISAVKDFDEIFVIENGRISERGDFSSLVKNRGWFYEQALTQGVLNE
ncbi:ABC transporter ATP-binding protein [Lagierella sp.]|uniref:ABC transporter ATP-binding protein n=1 Tax=Lagierella sp. TaxID=2849657 RepID=UPI0026064475|nr:ABC transporter ATP-binding protein [Lagierella sp.]